MNPLKIKEDWQQELIQAVTDPQELCRLLELDPAELRLSQASLVNFPLKVPRGFVARMQKGNPRDPLLLQVLPVQAEEEQTAGFSADPLDELSTNPLPGLLHKYQGRVLLTLTGSCAVNCRYCFRRHFPYINNTPNQSGWEKTLHYIAEDASISEVILSGGDPLLLNDRTLQAFSDHLAKIPHVKRLRIHSRIPVVLPQRLSAGFLKWIKSLSQRCILVIHCNHPQEINQALIEALVPLKEAGVLLLNQSVLLKGVNDQVGILRELSERLFEAGVQPYYLHLLDKVQGAAHFDLALEKAQSLHRELAHALPGYLVPKLVREVAGEKSKMIIASSTVMPA